MSINLSPPVINSIEAGGPDSKYALLRDEAQLWQRWEDAQDEKARDRIVHHYMSYARALAAKLYARRTHDEFEFQEYMQFASVGLMESVNRFQSSRGILFKTFATTRINGAILSGLAALSERQQQINMRRRVAEERIASLKKDTPDEDPEKLLRELAEVGVGLALGFLLEGTGMVGGEEISIPDNTYTRMELRQLQQQVVQLTRQLTEREREVIQMHYHQNMAFDEIATELQLTKGRISQLHKQGLTRLRSLFGQVQSCDITL